MTTPFPSPDQDPWDVQLEAAITDRIAIVQADATQALADAAAALAAAAASVQPSRQIIAGTGLTGGGTLAADRTLAVAYGTTAGTSAQGNDTRITSAVPNTRLVSAGTGLTGGGDLTADRTLAVSYGTASGTATQGNDTRVVNAVQTSRTLTAGTGLTGGGDLSANRSFAVAYGTSAGTAAEGNDTRITGAFPATGGSISGDLDVSGRALGMATPRNHGILAWAYDPAVVTNGAAATNGTVYLIGVMVNRSMTATKIFWGLNTAATTPTAASNHIGLYNSSGTRLATVDITSKMTVTGMQTETISQAVTPGLYWIGMVLNASTPGQPYRSGGLDTALVNVGLTAATARYATNGAGQTTLPSSITPSSNTFHHVAWWAALG